MDTLRTDPLLVDLGDGLVLRTARLADHRELAEFNATMHADASLPGSTLAIWTDDLFEVAHPTFEPERDVTVVEDTTTGRIVSALFLIPQLWTYAGVTVKVGQPELIATHPDYRRRGLVRAQFDVVHEWSRRAGHVWQFISGIPWYYRQFGYSYAIDLPTRPVLGLAEPPAASSVAPVASDAQPPVSQYRLRAATSDDVAFLADVETQATSGTTLGPWRGAEGFSLELARRPGGLLACDVLVIESTGPAADRIGYLAYTGRFREGLVTLRALELRAGQSWLGPTADAVAHLQDWIRSQPDDGGRGIRFALPDGHPALRCLATRLTGGSPGSYGLYVRAADPLGLVRAVAPALEARLAASPAVGWTGDLRVDLYTSGLHLRFDGGRLTSVEAWAPSPDESGPRADASMAIEDFLHLFLGNRRLDDLETASADCIVDTDAGALLLDVLFPRMPASMWEFC